MKIFWTLTSVCAAVLIIALLITFIVWRPHEETEEIPLATYLDSSVANDDERIATSYVSNTDSNMFMRGNELAQTVRLESQTAAPKLRTFFDKSKTSIPGGSLLADTQIFSGSFAPRQAVVIADTPVFDGETQTGTLAEGEIVTLSGETEDGAYYLDGAGRRFAKADAVRVCLRTDFEGDQAHPFAVDLAQTQYIRFSKAGESVYLRFETDNEYVSLFLENVPAGLGYELYDGRFDKVSARVAHTDSDRLEICYRGRRTQTYLLKLTGAPADEPVRLTFYRDDNEWGQNITKTAVNEQYAGKFDYYGDEDFFEVSADIMQDTDSLAMELAGVNADLLVCAYDRHKNLIGRYERPRGVMEQIVLYGLDDLYAVSVRTVDGNASGADYFVRFYYMDVQILGLDTYGFKISSDLDWSEDSDRYYTATCKGLTGKRIVEVQAIGKKRVEITLTTYSGAVYQVGEGDELPLHAGKNTLRISVINASDRQEFTLILTDSSGYDVTTAFVQRAATLKADITAGASVLAKLESGQKILNYGVEKSGLLQAELLDGSGKVGWVEKSALFAGYETTSMPAAYKERIEALQKAHPAWEFTFVRVGQTLDAAVASESGQAPIIYRNGGWQRADTSDIRYYMDPANFLNERDIFMFEKQVYKEGVYSDAGIGAVWTQKSEALASASYYAACFMEAGRVAGLSPYFIAARASLESGNGTSRLAKGECSGCEGYYNFYGIGAVDSNPAAGAALAKQYGWSSQRIAIVEGASWIKDQYISVLQYTPYFIKYSFVPQRKWHQYMTDVAAPQKDAQSCYNAHLAGGTLQTAIEFVIPVFN